ncbi:hypothetical protein ZIOFF_050903 [Zingiber officinale]|uniref:Uncharacterized protein n=1 Tax=Zingiber officinale TaxID=94328 RepID=A0A8J5FKY6_ZINOF|nr:hypothetical protein ZIOFF_050903 [Zingiber officinale]
MGEEGSPSSMGSLERDRELLIPVSMELHGSTNASSSSSHHHSGREHTYSVEEELYCVYVPTNHLYVGDIFLVSSKDIIRPNLSVREGIEIVVSTGMSMPQILTTLDPHMVPVDRTKI